MVKLSNDLRKAAQQLQCRLSTNTPQASARSADGAYSMKDVLLITAPLAAAWKFSWATDSEVQQAMENCRMTVGSLLQEMERRCDMYLGSGHKAVVLLGIMRERFRSSLLAVAPHKATQEDYEP